MTSKELFEKALTQLKLAESAETATIENQHARAAELYAKLAETAFLLESEPAPITTNFHSTVNSKDWDSPTVSTPIADIKTIRDRLLKVEDVSGTVATVGDWWNKWPDVPAPSCVVEVFGEHLVWMARGDAEPISEQRTMARLRESGGFEDQFGIRLCEVTHWRFLPEMPKEETK